MNPIESQHTEWKASWRDDLLRWVCAFANADGGCLDYSTIPDKPNSRLQKYRLTAGGRCMVEQTRLIAAIFMIPFCDAWSHGKGGIR